MSSTSESAPLYERDQFASWLGPLAAKVRSRERSIPLLAVCVAVVLLGVFFRFYHLDRKVFWEDEVASTFRALGYTEASIVRAAPSLRDAGSLQAYFHLPKNAKRDRLANTVAALAAEDPQHPPVYYVASHLWMERFGSSAAATRALSATFGVLALPCVFWLALELFGSVTAALVAVELVAVSPFHVLYAQEAREYSLWTIALALGCVAFLRARRLMTASAWSIYGVTLALGLYVFPFSALVALGQGLFLLVADRKRSGAALAAYGAAAGAAALSFAPWLWIMLTNRALERGMGNVLTAKISSATLVRILLKNVREIFFDVSLHDALVLNTLLAAATTVLVGYALFFLARHDSGKAFAFVLCALCAPALPLVASDLFGRGHLVYQSRYFTPLYLGLELAVAFLFASTIRDRGGAPWLRPFWNAALGAVLIGGLASCAISSQAATWWTKDYEQSRQVAAVVNASAEPLVVADDRASRTLGLGYYLAPRVRLRLKLSCDNCDDRAIGAVVPSARAAATPERFSDVFLLGTGTPPTGSRVRRIGVAVYPLGGASLNMFLRP